MGYLGSRLILCKGIRVIQRVIFDLGISYCSDEGKFKHRLQNE